MYNTINCNNSFLSTCSSHKFNKNYSTAKINLVKRFHTLRRVCWTLLMNNCLSDDQKNLYKIQNKYIFNKNLFEKHCIEFKLSVPKLIDWTNERRVIFDKKNNNFALIDKDLLNSSNHINEQISKIIQPIRSSSPTRIDDFFDQSFSIQSSTNQTCTNETICSSNTSIGYVRLNRIETNQTIYINNTYNPDLSEDNNDTNIQCDDEDDIDHLVDHCRTSKVENKTIQFELNFVNHGYFYTNYENTERCQGIIQDYKNKNKDEWISTLEKYLNIPKAKKLKFKKYNNEQKNKQAELLKQRLRKKN